MITEASPTTSESSVQERISFRAFAQAMAMIWVANHREDDELGDPKVGGHPASSASAMHILAALHLDVREPQDFVCCKPHCSPIDHALHHMLGLFRHNRFVDWASSEPGDDWFEEEDSKRAMWGLRKFPTPDMPHVFQSYHARTDPDHFHYLPSGTVGIPPVVSGYLALAHRYAADHGYEVPADTHFWSLIGDSEFREGSLLEAMPDLAERQLGNVTWIIDYNRQNLDGTRIPNERGLEGADCDRIAGTAEANGWRVIQVRHGKLRERVFAREGGECLREVLESHLSDYEFQMLALKREPARVREFLADKHPGCRRLVDELGEDEIIRVLLDLGGHCHDTMVDALRRSRSESEEPYMVIAHTLKGWGLECLADPSNHSALPSKEELEGILAKAALTLQDPFALFPADTEEGRFLGARRDAFRRVRDEHRELRERNRARVRRAIEERGGLPDTLAIDTSLFPLANTQWMWGQLAAKLVRIGTQEVVAPRQRAPKKELTELERRWQPAAEFVMTLSPDVGSSTNISPAMDAKIYGQSEEQERDLEQELEIRYRHPELVATTDAWTRHIRFEIAEANAMSAVGAFGKMIRFVGLPFFPIMTVYDFFIKRALDQLYYNVYWNSEFVIMGTPSGVTLSFEGAQHSWKSDIQMPNLITWEPCFAVEVDWILCDAIRRHMMDENEGRRGVLVRAVTRSVQQKLLLENVRAQAVSKQHVSGPLAPAGAGSEWGEATDESSLAPLPDEQLLARVREHCLAGGYKLVDWKGYAGYEPGDNVVNLFVMGSLVTEALAASRTLLALGIFADVIVVTSPELLLGIVAHEDDYRHLTQTLGITGDLFAVAGAGASEAGLLSVAGRRVPCVAVCDGEAGLLDNIGSIVGVRQRTLAVRKFSKCGRPSDVFRYQGLDADALVDACGQVLSETALENLAVSPDLLRSLAGKAESRERPHWRALWSDH